MYDAPSEVRRHALPVLSAGFTVDSVEIENALVEVHTPEFSFLFEPGGKCFLTGWTGAWPFARDTDLGVWSTVDEAVRYAIFLIDRENRQNERDEAMLAEVESE